MPLRVGDSRSRLLWALWPLLFAGCGSNSADEPVAGAGGNSETGSGGALASGGVANGGMPLSSGGHAETGTGGASQMGSGGTTDLLGRGGVAGAAGSAIAGGATGASGQGGASSGGDAQGGAPTGVGGKSEPAGTGSGGAPNAGGSSASGGSGSGGVGGYQPCPADSKPCKVLPLGDSITFGVNDEGNGGYRGPLFSLTVAASQQATFTGSLTNGPTTVAGKPFPQRNEGHSGWGISEVTPYSNNNAGIATLLPNPAFSSGSGGLPNIILLHIGTNDQGSYSAAQMTKDLSGLLDKLTSNAPDAYLVVAQIIPLGYGSNDVIKTYNQSIPGLVQQRAVAGKHITMIDMFTGFDASTMLGSDKIHPNSTGYKFMADRWYSVIGPLLPK